MLKWTIESHDCCSARLEDGRVLECQHWQDTISRSWFAIFYGISGGKYYAGAAPDMLACQKLAEGEVERRWGQYDLIRFEEVGSSSSVSHSLQGELTMATAAPKAPAKAAVAKAAPKATATRAAVPAPAVEEAEKTTKRRPPRDPKSLTTEEMDAAIEGTGPEPRRVTGTPDQMGLRPEDAGARGMRGRPIGLTTGLPIQGCWLYLFNNNEKAPSKPARLDGDQIAIPGSGKMTDEQLSAFMKREFPGRENKTFDNVNGCRRNQGSGQATRGTPPKLAPFRKYDENGAVVEQTRGKKAEAEEAEEPAAPAPATPAKKARA